MSKRLKEMEEEYQELMIESNGVQTEKIKELGKRIDAEEEDIKSQEISKQAVKRWDSQTSGRTLQGGKK